MENQIIHTIIKYFKSTRLFTLISGGNSQDVHLCDVVNLDKILNTDIVETTYVALKALYDSNSLVEGTKYLMVDHKTLHIIPNTADRNDTNKTIDLEPLLLTAISSSEFEPVVISTTFPDDIVYYDINNTKWGILADIDSMGMITRRIDPERNIDGSCNWRDNGCVFRTWELNLTTETGEASSYSAWDQSISVGQEWQSTDYNKQTFNTTGAGNYQDSFMFNQTKLLRNIKIMAQVGNTRYFPNVVFKENVEDIVNIGYINNCRFLKNVYKISSEVIFDIMATENIANIGQKEFGGNFIGISLGFPFFRGEGNVLVNTTLLKTSDQFAFDYPLEGYLGDIHRGHFKFRATVVGTGTISYFTFKEKRDNGAVSMEIESGSLLSPSIFEMFNARDLRNNAVVHLDFSFQSDKNIQYTPGVYSSLEYTTPAATSLANTNSSTSFPYFARKFLLTGTAGTIITTSILGDNGMIGKKIVPKQLIPNSAGLITEVTNNDVPFGIVTFGKTYQAIANNDEVINLEWVYDRYYVTSGRHL